MFRVILNHQICQHLHVVVDRVNAISVLTHQVVRATPAVRAADLTIWAAPISERRYIAGVGCEQVDSRNQRPWPLWNELRLWGWRRAGVLTCHNRETPAHSMKNHKHIHRQDNIARRYRTTKLFWGTCARQPRIRRKQRRWRR